MLTEVETRNLRRLFFVLMGGARGDRKTYNLVRRCTAILNRAERRIKRQK